MSTIEFSHTDWQNAIAGHDSRCDECRRFGGGGVVAFGVYDPSGNRVSAQLTTICGGADMDSFRPGVVQDAADRLAVAYPGMEVLVWADPFIPVADRRGQAFEPAAVGGGR